MRITNATKRKRHTSNTDDNIKMNSSTKKNKDSSDMNRKYNDNANSSNNGSLMRPAWRTMSSTSFLAWLKAAVA